MSSNSARVVLLAVALAAVVCVAPADGARDLKQFGVVIAGHWGWGWSLPAGIRSFNQAFGRSRAFAIPIGINLPSNNASASNAITVKTDGPGLAAAGTAGLGVQLVLPGGVGPTLGVDASGAATLGGGPLKTVASANGKTGSLKSSASAVGPAGLSFGLNPFG